MKRIKRMILLFFTTGSTIAFSQNYEVVKLDKVEKILNSENDTLYVLNFWATWCQPCVSELPYFEEMGKKYTNKKVKVILISIDFKSDVERRLKPLLEKKQLKTTVWFLDEKNQNEFIPKVEEGWSGAIPFTLFSRGNDGYKFWKEGKFTEKELHNQISTAL